ncbi:MAG: hypothetical protein GWN93_05955 [Deltaproteobacteria bacterium]|nr:hypothetical protein [Deltaproteobacteria bacterium]
MTVRAIVKLIEHVLAMKDDAYLKGHPEWEEIVKGAWAASHEMAFEALDRDEGILRKRYVGIGVFEHAPLHFENVVFVSTMEDPVQATYAQFFGQPVTSCWIETKLDTIELAVDFCEKARIDLPEEQLCHILEIGDDGWGLFEYKSDRWELVDSYCAIEAQERRMSDVAHANDVRFGAASDHEDWYHDYR